MSSSFGSHTGETDFSVILEFDAFAAPYILEERWRPDWEIEELTSGGVRIKMKLNHLVDVRRYVLSWGRHAAVMAPPELREAIREELGAMREMGRAAK